MRVRIVLGRPRRASGGNPFLSPLPVPVRAAVLSPGFAETRWVRVFPGGWGRDVEQYRPELVAATLTDLRRMAALTAMGRIDLSSLDCALVAFTGNHRPCLTDADRNLFWRVFEIPLFEQFLDSKGRVVAAECDAHEGLHILTRGFLFYGRESEIDPAPCRCGRPGPRIVGLREKVRTRVHAVAAAAG